MFSSKTHVSRKQKYQEALKASRNKRKTDAAGAEDGDYRAASSSWSPASLVGIRRHERGMDLDAEKGVHVTGGQ